MNDQLMELKKEKSELKKGFSNPFIDELESIVEKCFKSSKTKKEHFITREKVEIELLKLLQSQKKFKQSNSLKTNLKLIAVFDEEDNLIGRIKSIDFENQIVFFTDVFNKEKSKELATVSFFDVYSLEMQVFYERQKRYYDAVEYKKTFTFLTASKEIKPEIKRPINWIATGPKYQSYIFEK